MKINELFAAITHAVAAKLRLPALPSPLDPRAYFLGQRINPKPASRRDRRRTLALAKRAHLQTRPDFTAQIAAEKKAERGRIARMKAAGLR